MYLYRVTVVHINARVCVCMWRSRTGIFSQRTPFPARLRIVLSHLDRHRVTGQLSSDITVILRWYTQA